MSNSLFDLSAVGNDGTTVDFSSYNGQVVLVVNTASKCGFTPQYKGLEALYRKYKGQGFTVVGFPCDQFAHQEPGSDAEIAEFCEINYGVTFPLMSKIEVNGDGTHPVFAFLKKKAGGTLGKKIKWNFTKFLVGRDGETVKRFSPATGPEKIEKHIESALTT